MRSTHTSFAFAIGMMLCLNSVAVHGFVPPSPTATRVLQPQQSASTLRMIDANGLVETTTSLVTTSNLLLAETEAWVQPLSWVMGPTLNFLSFAMLCRVVASWYPSTNLNKVPWVFIAWPTEPLLRIAKGSIPPAFGVDITPVFWLAIFTFINEILLGQQGLLTMKIKYGI
eukprot:CAMPEP_0198120208 /NCGR_PEP_ID=MMETSP1442-20131203/28271_1 /TAXON_ID= /ORGANISM="Craspedostauros australis, Strain CCMP3328" /LENGTH=170 /DNA_ID=CAMNT_0043778817 /DNA_START=46 /DNA_END=558 /DNA_ORIENTATION=+